MWKTTEDFSWLYILVNVEGKGRSLEGRVNSKGECGNGGLRINAPDDAASRDDAKNDSKCLFNSTNEKGVDGSK